MKGAVGVLMDGIISVLPVGPAWIPNWPHKYRRRCSQGEDAELRDKLRE